MAKRKLGDQNGSNDWESPSSFNKLLKGLKKSSKRLGRGTLAKEKSKTAVKDNSRKRAKLIEQTLDSEAPKLRPIVEEEEEFPSKIDGSVEDLSEIEEEEDVLAEDSEGEESTQESGDEDDQDETEQVGLESTDPWEKHFGDHISDNLAFKGAAVETNEWETTVEEDPELHTVVQYRLKGDTLESSSASHTKTSLEDCKVKQRLHDPWKQLNSSVTSTKDPKTPFTPLQQNLFTFMNAYKDIMFTSQSHPNSKQLRHLYALHTINHVYKTRDRVLKNNARLKAETVDTEIRDQGFTRPKVLILTPFRNTAMEVVKMLIALSGTTQQDNKKRFFDEFGIAPEDDRMDPRKPEDHKQTFAGNIDDCFRVGIKFARKQLKLFAPFYSSDVILASPLGLRMVIGAEGDKKRDFDFLSAIEVVILDQTDVFLMQNWDHVQHIFDHLNLIPKEAHGCDFSRVRAYYLDGRAKYVRQTLIFSHMLVPEMNALFNKSCKNSGGKIKTREQCSGSICDVVVQVPQIFHRIPCTSPSEADDTRFKYFIEKILPTLRQSVVQQKHSMIFVPSYFDFVRLRNYLDEHHYDFVQLCEYTPTPDVSRARGDFFHGKSSYMLYTERFHFFRRYQIRGIRHIVFYGLPEYGSYYAEMINMLDQQSADITCTVLFTRYDRLKLERVVGSKRVARMSDGQKEVFMFT
ncbi:rRNA-binding ribosome biosynthesis protein UTP25 [Spizellomyces punctatus DAOM BR117]|uniref:U3 small nucleolar RNA-associated protein 25 n=1 Tax=Spizellomyces punctatus (strain DAOM BR117) TaxID=645134 RepID=A0A0L0HMQ0_SPIPD|nr:rRNA-binding ribosome biosynthesis protein UTP25 [Spizellomyces punctatus DAOM BR117]KND02358.1 hypothetical protein SPPG_02828 [Spizellomyces punctatus DAOM BR117]|eukprot:XP_016610397.1 hypothetical protein SPPG_02828 [Spizellomyces punctatus DAOM BR117]